MKHMIGTHTGRKIGLLIVILEMGISIYTIGAQEQGAQLYQQGVALYQQNLYAQAIVIFDQLRRDPQFAQHHADAYYSYAVSAIALDRLTEARAAFDYFIAQYPLHPNIFDAHYHRSRLYSLLGFHEQAIIALEQFRLSYPSSIHVGNSYYWSGEALLALGRESAAYQMFQTVVTQYPRSYRADAARYQLSLLDVTRQEEQLLDILRWSHEEYLALLGSDGIPAAPTISLVEDPSAQADERETLNKAYEAQIQRLQNDILRLEEEIAQYRGTSNRETQLLNLKNQLLDLKNRAIEQLDKVEEGQ